jgi:hypothetical protein
MAKKKVAKKKAASKSSGKAKWTAEETKVFKELGVGERQMTLRKLIRGQRRINGKLYDAIDLIVKHLRQVTPTKAATPELDEAGRLADLVPSADPPRCESGSGGNPPQ